MPLPDAATAQDARSAFGRPRVSKYRAKPVLWAGQRFASQAEFKRYGELLLLGQAGEIRNLELQPRFPLVSNGVTVACYVADYRYEERRKALHISRDSSSGRMGAGWIERWSDVVEDVKSAMTAKLPTYRLKIKLFRAQYPQLTFREVRPR